MLGLVLQSADLLSALFGLAGGVILAWPAWTGVNSKRDWEGVAELERVTEGDPESQAALGRIRLRIEADQLGDSRGARATNRWGFLLLCLAFVFLGIASVERVIERSARNAAAVKSAPGQPPTPNASS